MQKLRSRLLDQSHNKNEDSIYFEQTKDNRTLLQIAKIAKAYPYPHNMLGKACTKDYIFKLSKLKNLSKAHNVEGWYCAASSSGEILAASHLCSYGLSNEHSIWKIRHPMIYIGQSEDVLCKLLRVICNRAFCALPGSTKIVIFISEHEKYILSAANEVGFIQEAVFSDYYRLGETCYVYGKTFIS